MDALFELTRRLENMIRIGTIAEVDNDNALARVEYATDIDHNPVLTGWCPWLAQRAGTNRTWWAPEIGEQVIMLSPSGNLALAVIVPAINQTTHSAPSNSATKQLTEYSDGTTIEYDTETHHLTISVIKGGVTINATGDVAITAGGVATVDAPQISLNGGTGVVTNECICHFTGNVHGDVSTTVKAGK